VHEFFGVLPLGLNDRGDMVGQVFADGRFQSFAILDGAYSYFTIPGSYYTAAEGINNRNRIVGWYCKPDCSSIHGFLMDRTGVYEIDVPAEGSYGTYLRGISNNGFLVGSVAYHRFPVQEVIVGTPCHGASSDCVEAPRLGDPLIDFTVPAEIDVRPGSDVDPVNPRTRGVLPVAVLGSDEFTGAEVDQATVIFGPDGARPAFGRVLDVNGDGLLDLLLHFRVELTGISAGSSDVCMTGTLVTGGRFKGCTTVRIEPSKRVVQQP
jgi:hypothetical protein